MKKKLKVQPTKQEIIQEQIKAINEMNYFLSRDYTRIQEKANKEYFYKTAQFIITIFTIIYTLSCHALENVRLNGQSSVD